MRPFTVESRAQQWKVSGMKIYQACTPDRALQIYNNDDQLGAICNIKHFRGLESQLWDVQNV